MDIPKMSPPKFGSSPVQFLKEVKIELKKVSWPTQKEVVKMTSIVIFVSIAVGIFISTADFIFTKIMELIVIKL